VDTKNGKLCTKQVLSVLPIDHKDFVTNVQFEEFFDVKLRDGFHTTHSKPVKTSIYNPVYIIDESRKLSIKLSKYTPEDYANSTIWKRIMRALCSVLMMKGIEISKLHTESVFVNFLKLSMVGDYNTQEAQESNKQFILKKYAEKNSLNKLDGFFHILHDAELRFIYNILGQLPEQSIQFVVKLYAKKYYIHIGTTALYCISSKSIMIDYNIAKTYNASDTAKKTPIYKFSAKQQFNYFIEDIKRIGNNMVIIETPIFPTININNYNEVLTDSNQSFFITGPVGSRKSSLRLNLDVRDILNQNKDSKILMVADTKTMTEKIYSDMRYLVSEEGYNENIVGHYQKGRINEKTRIFIVCYDSVMKFLDYAPSHIILDEYKNITKRFTKVSNNDKFATNETKQNQINYFYGLMNRAKSVKIYDADCDDYILQNLKDKTNKKFIVFKLQNYIQYNDNISLKSELAAIKEIAILLSDGKKITISCAWKKLAHSLSDKFTQLNKRICVITSTGAFDNLDPDATNPTELKKQLVSDTKLWVQYDLIIYTPTITTGISYDVEHTFYKHYAFIGSGADATQQTQMIYRVRKLESRQIVIVSIDDSLCTLKSNVKSNVKIETTEDTYNRHTEANIDGHQEPTRFMTTPTFETTNLGTDFNEGYKQGFNAGLKNKNNDVLKIWIGVDANIEVDTSIKLLYDVMYKCYQWGSKIISFDFYDKITNDTLIDNKVIIYGTEHKFSTYIDYKNRHFQDAEFIDVDYNNLVENDGSQLYFDNQKSIALCKFGYSKLAYTHMKESIDSWFLLCTNDDQSYRAYTTARNINLYFEYKSVIFEIFEHSMQDKSIDFMQKTFVCKTINEPIQFINKIFGLYLSFKIFDILTITKEDIEVIYYNNINRPKWSFEKSKYLEPILKLVQTLPIQNTFSAICAFKHNRTNICKNEYKNQTNVLNFAFKSIGLKVQLNRQDQRRPSDRLVQITADSSESFRIQKDRIRTDTMCDNEYDDKFVTSMPEEDKGILPPKLRLAGCSEKNMIENWIMTFCETGEKYRLKGLVIAVDNEINKSRINKSIIVLKDEEDEAEEEEDDEDAEEDEDDDDAVDEAEDEAVAEQLTVFPNRLEDEYEYEDDE
jgi:hypothetical protein